MARGRYVAAALLAAATMAAVSRVPSAPTDGHRGCHLVAPGTAYFVAVRDRGAITDRVPTNIGNVEAYDIDEGNVAGTSTSQRAASVGAIHAGGAKAICYVETGGWESYRSDASEYSSAILGSTVPGYTDERYLDIRQWSDDPGPMG